MFAVCLTWGTRQTREPVTAGVGRQLLPCAVVDTRQIEKFAVSIYSLPWAWIYAHGKLFEKKMIPPSNFFLRSTYCTWHSMLSFGMFLGPFAIFSHFILLNWFLADKKLFTVCNTRQTLCRVQIRLYRVPQTHGKQAASRSGGLPLVE